VHGVRSPCAREYRLAACAFVTARYCVGVGKGYAEGSAVEARNEELERAKRQPRERNVKTRLAVFGSTTEQPDAHFLGWLGEVDEDALFASGDAWGLTYRRVPSSG
jgi:hypothetical protein